DIAYVRQHGLRALDVRPKVRYAPEGKKLADLTLHESASFVRGMLPPGAVAPRERAPLPASKRLASLSNEQLADFLRFGEHALPR
ncbi:MAG: hypothetical protein B7Z73_05475, partial [Planctomycetia bacterium 21-64-5]